MVGLAVATLAGIARAVEERRGLAAARRDQLHAPEHERALQRTLLHVTRAVTRQSRGGRIRRRCTLEQARERAPGSRALARRQAEQLGERRRDVEQRDR